MPQRQKVRNFSGGPQGPDALVRVKMPTVREAQNHMEQLKALGLESAEAIAAANKYLADHILSWNWVNDEGGSLPSPDTPGAFDDLLPDEVLFLGQVLSGRDPRTLAKQKKF